MTTFCRFPNLFSETECESIIEEFTKQSLEKALIFTGMNNSVRKNKVFWIERNIDTDWIFMRLINIAQKVNSESYGFNIDYNCITKVQFTKYSEGEFYGWHVDVGTQQDTVCRKLSISVQLSKPTTYEGGELQLGVKDDDVSLCPKDQGAVMIFPSPMRHRVTEVTQGVRYALVTWVTGYPFK